MEWSLLTDEVRVVILVRHAHAGQKAQWHEHDSLRPLTALGRAQATGLIASLAADDLSQAWSSPTVRCRQTLAPLAVDRGLSIEDHPLLAKGAPTEDLLEWMLAHAAAPWVLCTHGEVFNALLLTAHAAGVVTAPALVTEKGAAWRVTRHPNGRTEMEYLPPLLRCSPECSSEMWLTKARTRPPDSGAVTPCDDAQGTPAPECS